MTTGGLGERPQSPVQDGRPPEGREGSKAGGRRLARHSTFLHSTLVMSQAQHRPSSVADLGRGPVAQSTRQDKIRRDETRLGTDKRQNLQTTR